VCRRKEFQALLLYHLDSEHYGTEGTRGTIVGRLPSIRDRGQAHLKFELIKRRSPKELSAESSAVNQRGRVGTRIRGCSSTLVPKLVPRYYLRYLVGGIWCRQPLSDDGRLHVCSLLSFFLEL
jgi:hypothetical protein